jgi:Domain of unknown function (DUF222)
MFEDNVSPATAVLTAPSPETLLDELLVERPGPWLISVLDQLNDQLTTEIEHDKYLACWDRVVPWVMSQRASAMRGAAASQDNVHGPYGTDDFGPEVIALITGDTVVIAGRELETARMLNATLRCCQSALESGQISWRMADEVARATEHLKPWQQEQVDERMAGGWEIDRDIKAWRRRLRREVLRVDDDAEQRRKRAIAQRNVATWPLPDGMACVRAEIRAEDAAIVMAALNAIADKYGQEERAAAAAARAMAAEAGDTGPDDAIADETDIDDEWIDPVTFNYLAARRSGQRTMDQRRADAFVDVFADIVADPDPDLPKRQGKRPTVQVTGGLLTLLGLRNDPGELAGYGPITAEHLREIAADGEWHRFITAPDTGALISIGTKTYRPKQALRDFMIGAQPTCDFPGCSVPSLRTDAEHTVAHQQGGDTDEDNVCPRCRRHHRCKTHAGWKVERLPDGRIQWTTPSGMRRIISPHRLAGDECDDDSDDS